MSAEFHLPSILTAERIGRAAAESVSSPQHHPWVIVTECSPLGAAAMSAARHAANRGIPVSIYLLHPEADANTDFSSLLEVCGCMDLPVLLFSGETRQHWQKNPPAVLILGGTLPGAEGLTRHLVDLSRFSSLDVWSSKAPLPDRATGKEKTFSARIIQTMDTRATLEFGLPGVCLMENAGIGAFRIARHFHPDPSLPVAIFAGKGNNGGDALVVARGFLECGIETRIMVLAPESALRGDALVNYLILQEGGAALSLSPEGEGAEALLAGCGLVIDGLLGTGLKGPVQGPTARVIEAINASGHSVLALDIPSGLDSNNGASHGVVIRATATVTFAAMKKGLLLGAGPDTSGDLYLASIGMPNALLLPESE